MTSFIAGFAVCFAAFCGFVLYGIFWLWRKSIEEMKWDWERRFSEEKSRRYKIEAQKSYSDEIKEAQGDIIQKLEREKEALLSRLAQSLQTKGL